ncbi:hypothetical protein K438DRAFT_1941723 [Mycena galopus ATCC 62051]|nr:hypothetical protein K438DRAFT_1941723 [Mycena galopus ATCC 62051]
MWDTTVMKWMLKFMIAETKLTGNPDRKNNFALWNCRPHGVNLMINLSVNSGWLGVVQLSAQLVVSSRRRQMSACCVSGLRATKALALSWPGTGSRRGDEGVETRFVPTLCFISRRPPSFLRRRDEMTCFFCLLSSMYVYIRNEGHHPSRGAAASIASFFVQNSKGRRAVWARSGDKWGTKNNLICTWRLPSFAIDHASESAIATHQAPTAKCPGPVCTAGVPSFARGGGQRGAAVLRMRVRAGPVGHAGGGEELAPSAVREWGARVRKTSEGKHVCVCAQEGAARGVRGGSVARREERVRVEPSLDAGAGVVSRLRCRDGAVALSRSGLVWAQAGVAVG